MPALPEYRTRKLLEAAGVPLVPGILLTSEPVAGMTCPLFLKAQIPGATSRKNAGLVKRIDSPGALPGELARLLGAERCEGVLATEGVDIAEELYAAVIFDGGSSSVLPGGRILFSRSGGSGIESRSGSLVDVRFPLSTPPTHEELEAALPDSPWNRAVAGILAGMARVFIEYRLLVIEANPVAVLTDGRVLVVDCRAEYEERAVRRGEEDLFGTGSSGQSDSTPIEKLVDAINRSDPAGTAFFRQNRSLPATGAVRVATNLCGGGGKMLWEMAVGGRDDIFALNESDTSGGLSAFKSYRFLRAVLSQKDADLLLFTGSGMAFQSQLHIAAAIWKAMRESPDVVPTMVRFGGTDEGRARELFARIAPTLGARVETFPSEVFPNAMVDRMKSFLEEAGTGVPREVRGPGVPPSFTVQVPPGVFHIDAGRCAGCASRPCLSACPVGFLQWGGDAAGPTPREGTRCTGCLMCETACLLEGAEGLFIQLDMPEVE